MRFPQSFNTIMEGGPASLAAGEGDAELAASSEMDPSAMEEGQFAGPDPGDSWDAIDDFAMVGPPPEEPDVLHAPGPRYLDLARHEGGTPGAGMGAEFDLVGAAAVDLTDEEIGKMDDEDLVGEGDALRNDKLGITA